MRGVRLTVAVGLVLVTAHLAAAQPASRAMTPAEAALACAPPASIEVPAGAVTILGAQDTFS